MSRLCAAAVVVVALLALSASASILPPPRYAPDPSVIQRVLANATFVEIDAEVDAAFAQIASNQNLVATYQTQIQALQAELPTLQSTYEALCLTEQQVFMATYAYYESLVPR